MRHRLVLSIVLLWTATAFAEPWTVGQIIDDGIEMKDQHDNPRTIGPSVRAVLFARDMDGAKILRGAVGDGDAGRALLDGAGAVYVADVSRMPGLIRSMFAMPSLRRRGYPILIDLDGEQTAAFPSAEGRGTLVALTDLRVTAIEHFDSAEALRARLEALIPEERREPPPSP